MMRWPVSKRHNASDLVLTMLIWGVASVLVTRLFLAVWNNPSWQFGVWHIAHVLWGGLLLLAAVLLFLTTNGNRAMVWGAGLGGVGWGLFIDEVGKYLTRDNDYWFQPAIIFIYISFVLIFGLYRLLEKLNPQDTRTVLYSVLDQMGEILENDLEDKERKAILKNIDIVIEKETNINIKKMALALRKAVVQLPTVTDRDRWGVKRIIKQTLQMSYRLFRKRLIIWMAAGYSVYAVIDILIDAVRIIGASNRIEILEYLYRGYDLFSRSDLYMIGFKIMFDIVSAGLVGMGWYFLVKKKTLKALTYFQNGLLVSILFSSIFKFYFEQFSAVFGLFVNILVFYTIKGIRQEMKTGGNVAVLDRSDVYPTVESQT